MKKSKNLLWLALFLLVAANAFVVSEALACDCRIWFKAGCKVIGNQCVYIPPAE